MAVLAMVTTELCIYALRNLARANQIPFALLNERIQEYATVEQDFIASEVEEFTDRRLEEIVLKEGLAEFCWVTQTPPPHLPNLEHALCLTLTRERIQELLRHRGLLWYPLYRDGRGTVHIRPADINRLNTILAGKGMLDEADRIRPDKCSVSELQAILAENAISEKVADDGLGEIESVQFGRLQEMVDALDTAQFLVNRERGANVSKCPWLSKVGALLNSQGFGLALVPAAVAKERISNVSRVIVASDQPTPTLDSYRFQKQYIERPTRVRYMIINGKYALIHLPLPFTGRIGEQSNCVHWVDQPALVAIFRSKFNALWDGLLYQRMDR